MKKYKIIVAFIVMYFIWGSTYLGIRFAIETIPTFIMAGARFFISGLVFYLLVMNKKKDKMTKKFIIINSVLAISMIVIANGFTTWAEDELSSSFTALLVASFPMLLLIYEWLRPKGKRPTNLALIGTVIGFIAIIFLFDPFGDGLDYSYKSIIIQIIAILGWTYGTVYAKENTNMKPFLYPIAFQMILGGLIMFGIAAVKNEYATFDMNAISTTSILGFLYLTSAGALAYVLYYWLLQYVDPSMVATEAYVCPIIALFLGSVVANENVDLMMIYCSVFILLGVAMIVTKRKKKTILKENESKEKIAV